MWMPAQTTVPAFATARSAAGTRAPTGAKMIAASSGSGGALGGGSRPLGAQLARERLTLLVARAGEGEHAAALVPRHLRHDVRGGAEPVDAQPLRVSSCAERAMTDESGAEQRRRVAVGVSDRKREAVPRVRHGVLRVAPVHLIAGEPRTVAEVLPAGPAVAARPAGPRQPGHTHPVPRGEPVRAGAALRDLAHDLVPRDERQLRVRELTVDHVEIGSADAAGPHAQQHLPGSGPGNRCRGPAQVPARSVEQHGQHRQPRRRRVRSNIAGPRRRL